MPDNPRPPAISRREFARRAAIASAVASIAPAGAVTAASQPSQDPKAPAAAPPAPAPTQSPNMPKLSPESQAEADARFQTILVLYGPRFSGEQKNDIPRLCAVAQPMLDRVRAYKTENGDGTALYLKPQYEREKKLKPAPTPPLGAAHAATPAPKKP
jgi:hypothetical protein